jgi:Na+/proline symporter
MHPKIPLESADWLIIAVYFVVIAVVGIVFARARDYDDFLIHRGKTRLLLLLGSSLSTLVGAGTVFSMFELGYKRGLLVIGFGLAFSFGLFLTASVAERIKDAQAKHNIKTLPEYLGARYGSNRCARMAGLLNLIAFIFFSAAQFVAVGILLQYVTGISADWALIVIGALVIAYTASGGLRSDFVTDFIQFIVMLVVLVIIFVFLFGGFGNVPISTIAQSMRPASDSSWSDLFYLLGAFFLLAPSFPAAMDVWQRILAADSPHTARKFLVWSGISISLFFFGFGLFGMNYMGAPLNGELLPSFAMGKLFDLAFLAGSKWHVIGLTGFVVVGFLAIMQSTLGSMLLVSSVSLGNDVLPIFKGRSEKYKLAASRVLMILIGFVALILATRFVEITNLISNALASLAILFPAVFFGLLSARYEEAQAFWSIAIPFSVLLIIALLLNAPLVASVTGVALSWVVFFSYPRVQRILARVKKRTD